MLEELSLNGKTAVVTGGGSGLGREMALALAAVGIYGVISYTVSQQSHEIGIRMAMGAHTRDVLGMVVKRGMALALLGVAIGWLATWGVSRLLASLLDHRR